MLTQPGATKAVQRERLHLGFDASSAKKTLKLIQLQLMCGNPEYLVAVCSSPAGLYLSSLLLLVSPPLLLLLLVFSSEAAEALKIPIRLL